MRARRTELPAGCAQLCTYIISSSSPSLPLRCIGGGQLGAAHESGGPRREGRCGNNCGGHAAAPGGCRRPHRWADLQGRVAFKVAERVRLQTCKRDVIGLEEVTLQLQVDASRRRLLLHRLPRSHGSPAGCARR